MAAWLSVLGDRWNCDNCHRPETICSRTGHTIDDAGPLLAEAKVPPSVPLVFRAESVGVCPRLFMTGFGRLVGDAYDWWDRGQLGLDFMTIPAWINAAFHLFAAEVSKAMEFKRQE